MGNLSEIISFLEKNPAQNCNMINFIRNYDPEIILRKGNSVAIKAVSDHPWIYISSNSPEELNTILDELDPADKYFAVIEDRLIPNFKKRYRFKWLLRTIKYILSSDKAINENISDVSPLKAEDAETVLNNSDYTEYNSLEYVAERIKNGISGGIRIRNELAGWIMTHDDNAIGFLFVLEKFRRRGIADKLLSYMIMEVRKKGIMPFVHIEEKNTASGKLIQKYGFQKYGGISWFEIIK